jgi:hypothetical protein
MNDSVYKLICGVFSSEEAALILNQMISNKIRFHELKNFSHLERSGKVDKESLKRILELKKTQQKIGKIITTSQKKNQKIQINAGIELTLLK